MIVLRELGAWVAYGSVSIGRIIHYCDDDSYDDVAIVAALDLLIDDIYPT